MPLEERLELSIDDALSNVDRVGAALDESATSFKVALAEALDVLKNVQPVDVTADASTVTTDVTAAVQAADTVVVPEAQAGDITAQIDQAVKNADTTTKPIEADASDVTQGIDSAVAAADTTITVEADTSQAEDALAGLGDSGTEAGKGLSAAASGATDASSGLGLVGPAAGFAAGEMGNLKGVVGEFGPEAAAATGAALGLVAAGKSLFDAALEQQTAIERLNRTFGDQAQAVQQIHLGGLNTDLEHLSLLTGSNVDGLRNFAASFGQLGIDSGHAKEQVAGTVDQIIALASRAAVLNPNLGAADEIVQRLSTSLARGGRFLSLYGIALTAAEINARALIDTGKQSATELTIFEKSAAGAEIATERLGTKLGKDITNGAQSDAIQVRRLGVELEEAKKKAGAGLVEPATESMKALIPVLTDTIQLLGQGLTGALQAVEPALKAVGTAAHLLGGEAGAGGGIGLFGAAVKNLVGQINPIHQVDQATSLLQGHFSDFAHGLPAIGVAFDVFDKGKSKTEQLAEQTKKLADEQNKQAHATLIAAVSAETLSRADEVAAIQQHTAKDGTVDWVGVLEQLQGTMATTTTKSDQYSEAVANQAKATKEAAQGSQDLAQAQLGSLVATGQLTQAQLNHLLTLNLTKEGTVDYAAALKSVDPAAAAVAADTAIIAGGLSTVRTNMQLASDEAKLYKQGFDDLVQPTLNADTAQLKWQQTLESTNKLWADGIDLADAYKKGLDAVLTPLLGEEEANIKLNDTLEKVNASLLANKGAADLKTKAGRDDQQAVIDLIKSYDDEIDAMARSGVKIDLIQQKRQEEVGALQSLEHQYPGLTTQINDYITAISQGTDKTAVATAVNETHRTSLENVITAGEKWIETLIATGAPTDAVNNARQQEIDKLEGLKKQYPELGSVIDGYIAKLQAIPRSKDTTVNLLNVIQTEVDLANIHTAINELQDHHVAVTADTVQAQLAADRLDATLQDIRKGANFTGGFQSAGSQGSRMAGGPVWPGEWDVGEAGREKLFLFQGGGGFVVPNPAPSASAPAGGVSAAELDRLINAVVAVVQTQRPITVNEVVQNPLAIAAAVDARLGARVNF